MNSKYHKYFAIILLSISTPFVSLAGELGTTLYFKNIQNRNYKYYHNRYSSLSKFAPKIINSLDIIYPISDNILLCPSNEKIVTYTYKSNATIDNIDGAILSADQLFLWRASDNLVLSAEIKRMGFTITKYNATTYLSIRKIDFISNYTGHFKDFIKNKGNNYFNTDPSSDVFGPEWFENGLLDIFITSNELGELKSYILFNGEIVNEYSYFSTKSSNNFKSIRDQFAAVMFNANNKQCEIHYAPGKWFCIYEYELCNDSGLKYIKKCNDQDCWYSELLQ